MDKPEWWQGIPADEKRFREPSFPVANQPRETVSWYQAVAFCRWLSAKVGEAIMLPHEYEWEVAARWAGDKTDNRSYPWGSEFDSEKANTNEGGIGQTTAVGLYPAGKQSELNLYDLSGNVWEWCRNTYENPDDDQNDSSDKRRVLRGGAWLYNSYDRAGGLPSLRPSRLPRPRLRVSGGCRASFLISSRSLITVFAGVAVA